MQIQLRVTLAPDGKLGGYKSLDRAEEFMTRLLASETAKKLARECQVETPQYTCTQNGRKLYVALGFGHAKLETHTFSCWEEEGGSVRKVRVFFDALAGSDGAAEYNGNIMREWKEEGGEAREEDAGVHLLYRDGQLVKTLWIEAERIEN